MWRGLIVYTSGKIEDFSSFYKVSDCGVIKTNDGSTLAVRKRNGYSFVYLEKDGKLVRRFIHRIVASTYYDICGKPMEVVNHKNRDKSDNCVTNLEWCTREYNLVYGPNPKWWKSIEGRLLKKSRKFLSDNDLKFAKKKVIYENKTSYKVVLGEYVFLYDKNEELISCKQKGVIVCNNMRKPSSVNVSNMCLSEYIAYLERIFGVSYASIG